MIKMSNICSFIALEIQNNEINLRSQEFESELYLNSSFI